MPLSSLRHPLPPPSHHPSRDLHVTGLAIVLDSFPPRATVSPAAILSRDSRVKTSPSKTQTGRYSHISDLVGSPSNLRISSVTLGPSTFGFGHRIRSLRIYFGSSLDLSDSSLILEIGPFSEIRLISRPFTHPVPLPFPLPSSRIPPFPFLPPPLGCLLIFSLTRPPPHFPYTVDPQPFPIAHPLDPTPAPSRSSSRIPRLAVYHWPVTLSSTIVLFRFLVMTPYLLLGLDKHVQTWSMCTKLIRI